MRVKGLHVVRSGGLAAGVSRPAVRADEDTDEQVEKADESITMELRFAPFGVWYEVNSWYEGRFLERVKRGAFKQTIRANKRDNGTFGVRSLFNHGSDFQIGHKLLGTTTKLREADDSPEMLVDLYREASYVRDLIPGLRAGEYGSSFMFEVLNDRWSHEPERSEWNPEGLPERTIEEVRLYEAGPVTWPANPAATAGLRSAGGTDWWIERMRSQDPERVRDMLGLFDAFRAGNRLPTPSAPGTPAPDDTSRLARSLRLAELRSRRS